MSALASIFLSFDGRVVARRDHSRPGRDENAAGKWQAGHLTRTANEIQRAAIACADSRPAGALPRRFRRSGRDAEIVR